MEDLEKSRHHATRAALERLRLAKELLRAGNYITDVTDQIGYKSQSHLNQVFLEFTGRSIREWLQDQGITYQKKKSPLKTRLEEKLAAAKAHLDEGKTVVDTARLAGFSSPNHLANKFKDTFGMTPTEYQGVRAHPKIPGRINKLKAGKDYLLEGRTVAEAARLAGFDNRDQFSDMFKRVHSLSPSSYQQQNLEARLQIAIGHLLSGRTVAETVEVTLFRSGDQLTRLLKERHSLTSADYKNKALEDRLEIAKRELRLGKTVDEAAKLAGYKKGNYLYQVFLNHCGMTPSEFREQRYDPMIDAAVTYFREGMKMRDAAKRAGFGSVDHFANQLKKKYRRSLRSHIAYLKKQELMETSKKYLLDGMTVAEVASALGFNSANQFTITFKRTYSLSPIQFQNQNESEQIHIDEMMSLGRYYLLMGKPPRLASALAGFDSITDFTKAFQETHSCTPEEYISRTRNGNSRKNETVTNGTRRAYNQNYS